MKKYSEEDQWASDITRPHDRYIDVLLRNSEMILCHTLMALYIIASYYNILFYKIYSISFVNNMLSIPYTIYMYIIAPFIISILLIIWKSSKYKLHLYLFIVYLSVTILSPVLFSIYGQDFDM